MSETTQGEYIDQDDFPWIDAKLIEDYNMHRVEIVPLNTDLDLGRPITLISDSKWNDIFDGVDLDEGWRRFYERADCNWINEVSRVGFNAQMDKALVFFSGYVASLAGHFGVMLLSKGKDGDWQFETF